MARLTAQITAQAIAEITAVAAAEPFETDEIIETPDRYLDDAGMTAERNGKLWTTPVMEEDGQRFQGYIWQHESGTSIVATVLR